MESASRDFQFSMLNCSFCVLVKHILHMRRRRPRGAKAAALGSNAR